MGAVTVAVAGQSQDEIWAAKAAKGLKLTQIWVRPDYDNLLSVLPQTVKFLKGYSPVQVRNALVSHVGLLMAKELNAAAVMTGEGSGSSPYTPALGEQLRLQVHAPFLHSELSLFGKRAPAGGSADKALWRLAFAQEIPQEFLERPAEPPERGAGTQGLTDFFRARFADAEFHKESEAFLRIDGVRLRDKEHLYYYKLYRSQFGPPRKISPDESAAGLRGCPDCGAAVEKKARACALCGAGL
jgi:asparagine synthase (glutamine-hydrolysing)